MPNTFPNTTDQELVDGIKRHGSALAGTYSYGHASAMRAELIRRNRSRAVGCSVEEYLAVTKGE